MKTDPKGSKQGGAMITAMLFSFIALAMVGSYLTFTAADAQTLVAMLAPMIREFLANG